MYVVFELESELCIVQSHFDGLTFLCLGLLDVNVITVSCKNARHHDDH